MKPLASIISVLASIGVFVAPAQAAASDQVAFDAWKAAHPFLSRDIAELKARTAALVAAQRPLRRDQAGLDRPPAIWRVPGAPTQVWDSPDAPKMVVIPAGEYTMGWRAAEPVLFTGTPPIKPGLATRHRVRIAYPLAFSEHPVTVGEFARFVAETGYDAGNVCQTGPAGMEANRNWKTPGYAPTDDQPVVCINSADAQAYVAWLAKRTGLPYRLPSEAEYEYAQRAGSTTAYWWGEAFVQGAGACNGCGSEWDNKAPPPVGRFAANPFGLRDIAGSVWSRTADCWVDSFDSAPADGSANLIGACSQAVLRGGAYRTRSAHLRSAIRHESAVENRYNDDGFHVVRTL